MARFGVYRSRDGGTVLECQAYVLTGLNSRLVVPLEPEGSGAPAVSARLNPTFDIAGEPMVMKTHFAAAIPVRDLGERIASLEREHDVIQAAFDMLLTGV